MHILVVLRMVPAPATEFEILPDGLGLDREWMDFQLNDFDDQALEESILLKESSGARVTAVAIGEGANRVLQMAIARGADEAILLTSDEEASLAAPASLAAALMALMAERKTDLVLTGVQSAEDLFGQLGPYLAGRLDWPHISGTSHLAVAGGSLTVAQERGNGVVARYRIALPAVLGVQTSTKAPRYVSGSKLREAAKAPIAKGPAVDNLPTDGARLAMLSMPLAGEGAEDLGNVAEHVADRIAHILAERGLRAG